MPRRTKPQTRSGLARSEAFSKRKFEGSRWCLRQMRSAMGFECHFGTHSTQTDGRMAQIAGDEHLRSDPNLYRLSCASAFQIWRTGRPTARAASAAPAASFQSPMLRLAGNGVVRSCNRLRSSATRRMRDRERPLSGMPTSQDLISNPASPALWSHH